MLRKTQRFCIFALGALLYVGLMSICRLPSLLVVPRSVLAVRHGHSSSQHRAICSCWETQKICMCPFVCVRYCDNGSLNCTVHCSWSKTSGDANGRLNSETPPPSPGYPETTVDYSSQELWAYGASLTSQQNRRTESEDWSLNLRASGHAARYRTTFNCSIFMTAECRRPNLCPQWLQQRYWPTDINDGRRTFWMGVGRVGQPFDTPSWQQQRSINSPAVRSVWASK